MRFFVLQFSILFMFLKRRLEKTLKKEGPKLPCSSIEWSLFLIIGAFEV